MTRESPNPQERILKGRATDPAVREGIALLDFPAYVIAEVLDGDGLQEVHARLGAESLTPASAADVITQMIQEYLADAPPPADDPPPARRGFVPTRHPVFPNPVISRPFGRRRADATSTESPSEDESQATLEMTNGGRVDFRATATTAVLMRAESTLRLWRQGRVTPDDAIFILEGLVRDYRS